MAVMISNISSNQEVVVKYQAVSFMPSLLLLLVSGAFQLESMQYTEHCRYYTILV